MAAVSSTRRWQRTWRLYSDRTRRLLMAGASDVVEIERTGERFVFTRRPRDTNGELLEIEFYVKEFAPPAHIHLKLEERVEVLSGRARVWIGGEESIAGPGGTV